MGEPSVLPIDTVVNLLGGSGGVGAGTTDSGNPVKVGGKYNSTLPTLTDGQRGDVQLGTRGGLHVDLYTADTTTALGYQSLSSDGIGASTTINNTRTASMNYLFNGSTFDRARNNHEVTLLASAARTATSTGSDQTSHNARAAYIVIDVTGGAAAPGLTPAIQAKDSLSGKYVQIHANLTKITATGTYVYFFGVGAGTAAGGVTATSVFPLPRVWRLVVTADDATSYTYSAAVNFIV